LLAGEAIEPGPTAAGAADGAAPQPPLSRVRKVKRFALAAFVVFAFILLWLIVTAPLSR